MKIIIKISADRNYNCVYAGERIQVSVIQRVQNSERLKNSPGSTARLELGLVTNYEGSNVMLPWAH